VTATEPGKTFNPSKDTLSVIEKYLQQ